MAMARRATKSTIMVTVQRVAMTGYDDDDDDNDDDNDDDDDDNNTSMPPSSTVVMHSLDPSSPRCCTAIGSHAVDPHPPRQSRTVRRPPQ